MTPLAWFLGLLLPACAASGAAGLPAPALMTMDHIVRPASPNTALAAPAGSQPAPDLVTPRFPLPAPRLYQLLVAVAQEQPRTFLAAQYVGDRQAHFVARSAVLNFPDLITAQVAEAGPDASTLVLYSRSLYGYSDFGVNRKRLSTWLAAITSRINHSVER
jgi:uncharacterized protein (DUF1499 family)